MCVRVCVRVCDISPQVLHASQRPALEPHIINQQSTYNFMLHTEHSSMNLDTVLQSLNTKEITHISPFYTIL